LRGLFGYTDSIFLIKDFLHIKSFLCYNNLFQPTGKIIIKNSAGNIKLLRIKLVIFWALILPPFSFQIPKFYAKILQKVANL